MPDMDPKETQKFEKFINRVSRMCEAEGYSMVAGFGRVGANDIAQIRTRMMGAADKKESLPVLWMALRELERTRMEMEKMAEESKIDLNKYFGKGYGRWQQRREKPTMPGLP